MIMVTSRRCPIRAHFVSSYIDCIDQTFDSEEEARDAVKNMNGKPLHG